MSAPWRRAKSGVEIYIRVTAKADADRISGLWTGPDGARRFSVRVAAAPEKGKANAATVKVLARALSLPASKLSLISGDTDRLKTLLADGEAFELENRLAELMRRLEGAAQQ